MEKVVLIVHVLTALSIIGLILMQQGKGAEAGASFGAGASQTVFGSQGSGNFFTRATSILAAVFFITSFGLAVLAKQQASVVSVEGMPEVQDEAPVPTLVEQPASDVPTAAPAESGQGVTVGSDVPAVNEVPAAPAAASEDSSASEGESSK